MTWELSLAGLLVGVLVGLTGMGGGSLLTPLLVLGFGFNPAVAVGTDILHGAAFKSVGAVRHRTLGTVQARLSGWMFIGSAPMSLAGVALATWLARNYGDDAESAGRTILGIALAVGGAATFAKLFLRPRDVPDGKFVLTRRDRIAAVAIGAIGGFVVGLTSVGSGVFFALTMLIVFPLRSSKVVGTDIFHAAALLWVAGIGHLVAGNVDMGAIGWLLVGSIPGVLIGSPLAVRVPDRLLRATLAAILLLSGLKLVEVPGGDVVLAIGAVLAVLALALAALLGDSRRPLVTTRATPPGRAEERAG
jgi:uncharacterized membrane protein YfcA